MNNNQIILNQIIDAKLEEFAEEITRSDYFELFSASELLKDYDLSFDEIEYGNAGKGGDGGIDSIYCFVNGEFINEDTEINANQRNSYIELIVIQSKTSPRFTTDAIQKFCSSAEDLFDLSKDITKLKTVYNSELLKLVERFRNVFEALAPKFPRIAIRYFYASTGDEVHQNVERETLRLEEIIKKQFNGVEFQFNFVGAKQFLELQRQVPSTSRQLTVAETPIGTEDGSYICLVNLLNYFEFLCDNGKIARSIFEANVRDYSGSVSVNKQIQATLENSESDNFWYLNNGVTIITKKAVSSGKKITIEDPRIVNGLQTSHEIYNHFVSKAKDDIKNEARAVLVRVICEENAEARDRIIRATNAQSTIPPASLRGSDEIHRNIEDYLKPAGLYYDRKKNFYKNEGISRTAIVSIPSLAQAVMATLMKRPDAARARPSTLLNNDKDYRQIFNPDYNICLYQRAIELLRRVDIYLKSNESGLDLSNKDTTNIKFYVAMLTAIRLAEGPDNLEQFLSTESPHQIDKAVLDETTVTAMSAYEELGATDQVAKGPDLVRKLLS